MSSVVCRRAIALIAALGAVWSAQAQATRPADTPALPLWELGLGAGALALPHYRGSDQTATWLLPVPFVVIRGDRIRADRDGARAVLLEAPAVELDLSANASAPTSSGDNAARRGMPDLDPSVELGPNLNWTWARGPDWRLQARLPVRAVLALSSDPRWIGWRATPNLNLDLERRAGWTLGLQGGPVFGSRKYHDTYYTVTPAQALPDRPSYTAHGGYGGLTLTAAASRRDGDRWFGAFVQHDRLAGASFDDSPLVRRRVSWSAGLAVSWVLLKASVAGSAEVER